MKKFQLPVVKSLMLYIAILTSHSVVAQESIKIGRSNLTLPDYKQWTISSIDVGGVDYTGDVSGSIPMETKKMVYKSADQLDKAAIVVSVTKSAIAAEMSWANTCASFTASQTLYVKDDGGTNRLDCLIVIRVPRIAQLVTAAPGLKPLFSTGAPHTLSGYYIQYSKGLSNGAQTSSYALLAEDFVGLSEGQSVSNPSQIPTPVVRWALAFAQANSRGLTSLTGSWELPAVKFQ